MFNLSAVKTVGTRLVGQATLLAKNHGPSILTVTGVVGIVTAGVMASRATLKLEAMVDNIQVNLADAGDSTKAKTMAYVQGGFDIVKLYGPSVTLGAASVAAIVGAHGMMQRRNAALVVAYKGLEKTFTEYRKRVIEELGVEEERELYYGVKREVIQNEETGKEEVVYHANGSTSLYARPFDELNVNWKNNPTINQSFIFNIQNMLNDKLHAQGHLFLNEAYDALGFERTPTGNMVGWMRKGDGDGYVDFGLHNFLKFGEGRKLFLNGSEASVWLDFNVDGYILDKDLNTRY